MEQAHEAFDKDVELMSTQFMKDPVALKGHFATKLDEFTVKSMADWDSLKNRKLPVDRMKKMVHLNKGFVDKNESRAYLVRLDKAIIPSEKICKVTDQRNASGDQFLDSVVASLGRHVTINIRQDVVDQLVKSVS